MIDKDVACAENHVKSKSSYTAMYSKSNSRGVMTLSVALRGDHDSAVFVLRAQ